MYQPGISYVKFGKIFYLIFLKRYSLPNCPKVSGGVSLQQNTDPTNLFKTASQVFFSKLI